MAQDSFSLASRVKLSNGLTMPRIHLGVYLTSGKECSNATRYALESGYRAIDSAQMYHNEHETGTAIKAFLSSTANAHGLERKDIHFTSKLASNANYDRARQSIKRSVKECGLGYIDLFLLHSPYGGKQARLESWRAVEDAIESGEVRMGGVSNYGVKHLKELLDSKPKIHPAVNQMEVHPFNTQLEIVDFCKQHDILIEAYAPLARAMRKDHPVIQELAGKYGCSWAQLMVRWSLQQGYICLPKSVKRERIEANGRVEGFEIEEGDMKRLDGLDEHLVTDWEPMDAD